MHCNLYRLLASHMQDNLLKHTVEATWIVHKNRARGAHSASHIDVISPLNSYAVCSQKKIKKIKNKN